ncbi:hypothetical protein LY76DRAFT_155765 [Colletotrichum caudatum]|nr:hypothetical protein LY76DRAFT_155765 [Colletotrichum caudatum]
MVNESLSHPLGLRRLPGPTGGRFSGLRPNLLLVDARFVDDEASGRTCSRRTHSSIPRARRQVANGFPSSDILGRRVGNFRAGHRNFPSGRGNQAAAHGTRTEVTMLGLDQAEACQSSVVAMHDIGNPALNCPKVTG